VRVVSFGGHSFSVVGCRRGVERFSTGRDPPTLWHMEAKTGEWVSSKQAGAMLGISAGHVGWLIENGRLTGELRGRKRRSWWISRAEVENLASERASWITYVEAAALVGCSNRVITRAVRTGQIESRARLGVTREPSLRRTSVRAFALVWAQERAAVAERAPARSRPGSLPPDDEHVWLSTRTAALVLGMTPTGVRYRVHQGLLPHVRRRGRLWFRREHVEQAAAARAFRKAAGYDPPTLRLRA
jgi:hypothetical protein